MRERKKINKKQRVASVIFFHDYITEDHILRLIIRIKKLKQVEKIGNHRKTSLLKKGVKATISNLVEFYYLISNLTRKTMRAQLKIVCLYT